MSVLIDTSVWIEHFRNGNRTLVNFIGLDLALIHPMVLGEIACGTPPAPQVQTLTNLALLRECKQASASEVMAFSEREELYGFGCGWVDISLLAATLINPGATIWTLDKRLYDLAKRFNVAHIPSLH